jgi:predicted transposase YbfD/YdcC
LLDSIAKHCQTAKPRDQFRSLDKKLRLRYEIREVDVFLPGEALEDTEWKEHVAAIIRVYRETRTRSSTTGLWKTTEEVAHYVCDFVPTAQEAARAIREHWGIENRLHYVRDGTFAEDASRIRENPGVFARIRSFAGNILRINDAANVAQMRYRIAIAGLDALQSMCFM